MQTVCFMGAARDRHPDLSRQLPAVCFGAQEPRLTCVDRAEHTDFLPVQCCLQEFSSLAIVPMPQPPRVGFKSKQIAEGPEIHVWCPE